MTMPTRQAITRIEVLMLRSVMLAMAAATAVTGATLLTTPYALPAVIGLWLGATGMFALGVWGRLPDDA